jgi:hypothetical protein
MVFFELLCASRGLITQPRDAANSEILRERAGYPLRDHIFQ